MAKERDSEKLLATPTTPNSIEAEQNLLCCIMRNEKYQLEIISQLVEDDFYQRSHQDIFGAMKQISLQNKTVGFASVLDELRRNGKLPQVGDIDYITKLYDLLPGTALFAEYLEIVLRASTMRRLINICSDITKKAYSSGKAEEVLAFAEEQIFRLSQRQNQVGLMELASSAASAVVTISKRYANPDAFHGINSGYYKLDQMTNGFHGGELLILAARPGVGKSALAMNMVENIAKQGKTVAIFSLEMSNEQLMERLISSMSTVPLHAIKSGQLPNGENDIAKINQAYEVIASKMHLYGNDNPSVRLAEIRSQCRRLKMQHGLDMVLIDYIGLMESDPTERVESRQNEVSKITRGLKVMAKELNVPVMALSQLKREAEMRNIGKKDGGGSESIPVLSDLRESGAIEQDADIVMFIHREKDEDGNTQKVTLSVAKHRNGETGNIPLSWNGNCVKFLDDRMIDNLVKTAKISKQQEYGDDVNSFEYNVASNESFEMEVEAGGGNASESEFLASVEGADENKESDSKQGEPIEGDVDEPKF